VPDDRFDFPAPNFARPINNWLGVAGQPPTIEQAMEHQRRWGENRTMAERLADIAGKTGETAWNALPTTIGAKWMERQMQTDPRQNDPEAVRGVADVALSTVGGGMLGAERGALGMAGGKGIPKELYHVAGPEYQSGSPLQSLYRRLGNEAYDEFAKRWPEAGDLGQYHAHNTFFYDNLADALDHADNFGGKVLKVDPSQVGGLTRDKLERPHGAKEGYFVTTEDVPHTAISPVAETAGEGIRAYHGSPHDFEKFDVSKIGTGEGAQAYGHGLYFAERPGVAESYKTSLSSAMIDKKPADKFLEDMPKIDTIYDAIRHLKEKGQSPTIEDAAKFMDTSSIPAERRVAEAIKTYGSLDNVRRMMNKADVPIFDKMVKEGRVEANPGKMYEVAIKAHPDEFLDWDKPLSEQHPKVQEAVKATATYQDRLAGHKAGKLRHPDEASGAQWLSFLKDEADLHSAGTAGPLDAAGLSSFPASAGVNPSTLPEQILKSRGIPGIKYLDQGSRAKGEGSRNYVVFHHDLVDIMKKYGLAGLSALPAAGAYHFRDADIGKK
jgi:hypothetical protein